MTFKEIVITGLVPVIHAPLVNGRVKPGHDGFVGLPG